MSAAAPLARLMQGNEAVAAARLTPESVFRGLPDYPFGEIAEIMAGRLPRSGGKFIRMAADK